jgi:hypothetical protein
MQDNVTIHITKNSVVAISEVFGESHKSRIVVSAITRLKSLCPLSVGHTEKYNICAHLQSLEELQERIRHEISVIPAQHLQHASRNI